MTSHTIKEIEDNIKEARKTVELGHSLERLFNNRDFKKIVLEGYFRDEAIRLVHLKGDPAVQSAESQAAIIRSMEAISELSNYFRNVRHQVMLAEKSIQSDEAMIEELLEEEL